ncbi:hypothetical protein B0T16DRAFT_450524 [Cercophora newfieldiana]|uniref:DUF1275 domain protein n=1 Tax=Cercophora newfieldiana TaxID=92897 RepID=A0AA39YNA2_9PEZI|nr:hypothetical protein B0T16DRAFT_450524 [Cercophora newfieldiana]
MIDESGATTPTQPKQQLPPPRKDVKPASSGLLAHLRRDIDVRHADLILIVCCMLSGLCDSVAFNATGAFVSMQTGNTIILSLGAASLPPNQPTLWLRALISLVSFWLGCFFFARFARHFLASPRSRLTLFASFAIQSCCLIAAAALAQSHVIPSFAQTSLRTVLDAEGTKHREEIENNNLSLAPLALMAFQFGGQIVASRTLGYNEVPTNVLTSLYCDFLSDPLLFSAKGGIWADKKRNRRFAAVVMSFVGGISGGWVQRSKGGMAAALWMAVFIKVCTTVGWLCWKAEKKEGEGGKKAEV